MYLKKRMNAVITACILMTGAFVASCSNDDAAPDNAVATKGDPVKVTVTIDQSSANTRGSGSNVAEASNAETKIEGNLVVFVFDATAGSLELLESTHSVNVDINAYNAPGPGAVAATATSDLFEITTGDKYFYIFANADKALTGSRIGSSVNGSTYLRSLASAGMTHKEFRENVLFKNLLVSELSTPNEFLIGTLWEGKDTYTANKKKVELPTPPDIFVNIEGLQVGRLVSKISFKDNLFDAQFNTATDIAVLKGGWSTVKWRLVNQPDEMYLVGNWDGSLPGFAGSQVKTPFFTSDIPFWNENGTFAKSTNTNPVYTTPITWSTDASLYTLENTHGGKLANGDDNFPRKGNTTAVQFQGKFTPTDVLFPSGAPGGTLDAGTFWAAVDAGGVYRFYSGPPTDGTIGAIKYTNGMVYYLAYIKDTNESEANNGSTMYAVLRNHQYSLTIGRISGLDDNNENPFDNSKTDPDNPTPDGPDEPEDPIISDVSNISLQIEVLKWNLINQRIEW